MQFIYEGTEHNVATAYYQVPGQSPDQCLITQHPFQVFPGSQILEVKQVATDFVKLALNETEFLSLSKIMEIKNFKEEQQ